MSWICLIIYVIIHFRSKGIVEYLNSDFITPANFTLYILNIPKDKEEVSKDYIEDWIKVHGTPKGIETPEIAITSMIYD